MRERLPQPVQRVLDGFNSFTVGQKAVTIAAVLALVVGGYFFTTWASKPAYAPLFNNLSGTDASAIVESLTASGTPYELADGGATIMVPRDQVYDLRIQLSGEGLPGEAETGYALLDKQGVTTSQFMQHVGYQRALEGELANTIKAIKGVEAATVHLVMPQKDVFADDQKKPTASVLVASKRGEEPSSDQVQSIVHLVASSVEGLEPEQVTVAGSDGQILSTGRGQAVGSGAANDAQSKQVAAYEQRTNAEVQRMLENVVGPGHATVITKAELDFDQTETRTRTYNADPAVPPIKESTTTETYNGTGTGQGGVLGQDNVQVPNGAGNGQYNKTEAVKDNPVGSQDEVRRNAPGKVRKQSVAVMLDSRVAAALDAQQVQEIVTAAAGIDAVRGDRIAVSSMPFDQSAAEKAKADLAAAGAVEQQEKYMTMAKTGALVLVVLVLLFIAWRRSKKQKRSELTPEELAQLEAMQAELEELRALSGGNPDMAALEASNVNSEERDGRRKEITQMVDNQPDDVAALLRGWMTERR